jgi:hypothetical protein
MPRPCLICSDHQKLTKAAELIVAGNSDQAVANALNALTPDIAPMSLMAVSRHRRLHIMKPVQDRLTVVSKGAAPRRERQQLALAAASGAPTPQQFVDAFFGLKAQGEKLQRIEDRLERMATLAEDSKSPGSVATVAAQQLRSVETGARLAGVGGYVPARAAGPGEGVQFNLTIQFGDGREERITTTTIRPGNAAGTIDAVPEPVEDEGGEFDEDV